jgi:hypothetical protein
MFRRIIRNRPLLSLLRKAAEDAALQTLTEFRRVSLVAG